MRNEELEELKWKKFPVLNDGFVCLVDAMGSDQAVVAAARVSYGKDTRGEMPQEWEAIERALGDWVGTQGERDVACRKQLEIEARVEKECKDDRTLIRYLMRYRHTTPFEMAELKFLVRVPMDCWRQWVRHRTASINEYSTRYTEAIDSQQTTEPGEWRLQDKSNKQGSVDYLKEHDDTAREPSGNYLSRQEIAVQNYAKEVYQDRLEAGVAREQARKDLPLSTYTEAYWKIDLHNLLHFLSLRMDAHAQKEIRDYATIIGEQIVAPLFPQVWEAFVDYRLQGMFLTRLDQLVVENLLIERSKRVVAMDAETMEDYTFPYSTKFLLENHGIENWNTKRCRERDECLAKLQRLGLIRDDD